MISAKLKPGTRFGNLTIVKWDMDKPGGKYKCKCDCGRFTYFTGWHLRIGKAKSCFTCHHKGNRVYIIGDRVGSLTIVGYVGRFLGYKCKCDCGRETIVRTWSLREGKTKRCWHCGRFGPKKRLPFDLGPKKERYRLYRRHAIVHKQEFKLSLEQFIKYIDSNCHYCGAEPADRNISYSNKQQIRRVVKMNGIDRVDNSVGYNIDNCVPSCSTCNKSKLTLSLSQWREWIKRVYNKQFGGK